ncbi:hypothetical protein UY3_16392 [Chelonia mydas]|uniref:Uncharacterized protein n=1 Tax=Chelonia mydas TaxID=8469 RepID=M7AU74_CHEMY|nr:hypothetical protein UY3_16392 [Chelonia mydas]
MDALIIGALGAWDPCNECVLRTCGIGRHYAWLMRPLMVSDIIRWSRDIYIEHLTDITRRVFSHSGSNILLQDVSVELHYTEICVIAAEADRSPLALPIAKNSSVAASAQANTVNSSPGYTAGFYSLR